MDYTEELAAAADQYRAELLKHYRDKAGSGVCLCGVDCRNPTNLSLHIYTKAAGALRRYEATARRLQREAAAERAIAYEAMRPILPPAMFDRLADG